jgi:hypothetical protein
MASTSITLEPAPTATLGRTDATRRWAMRFPDGELRFAGTTRVEADHAGATLEALAGPDLARALVRVELGVVLSDGAGPYLVDVDGALVLVVGSHGASSDVSVAISEAAPDHDIGLVAPLGSGVWIWRAVAAVAPGQRVMALDQLADCGDLLAAQGWEARWNAPAAIDPAE